MPSELSPTTHVYAGNPLDRGDRERRDEGWLRDRTQDAASRFLPLCENTVLVTGGDDPERGLGWLSLEDVRRLGIQVEGIFLGLRDGAAHFTVDLTPNEAASDALRADDAWAFEDTRAVTDLINRGGLGNRGTGAGAGELAQPARLLLRVRAPHGDAGAAATCASASSATPSTSPARTRWSSPSSPTARAVCWGSPGGRLQAMNRYSALAGFMDQGESIEEAVAREIMEEAGIRVRNVRYDSSQPWPFPSTLMIGLPRRRRDDGHPHGHGRDGRRPLVHPRGGPRRPGRRQRRSVAAGAR